MYLETHSLEREDLSSDEAVADLGVLVHKVGNHRAIHAAPRVGNGGVNASGRRGADL
jgi:hypothetical protein